MAGQLAQSKALVPTVPLLLYFSSLDVTFRFFRRLGLPCSRLSQSSLSCCLRGLLSIMAKYPAQPERERSVLLSWMLQVPARSGSGLAGSSAWQRGP